MKVSIIVNCYNGENYLNECLSSIKNQTYKNYEVIFLIIILTIKVQLSLRIMRMKNLNILRVIEKKICTMQEMML